MSISKKQSRKIRQPIYAGSLLATGTLDSGTTQEIVDLEIVADQVTFQASDDLAGNIAFSVDGINFDNQTNFATSNQLKRYSTTSCTVVKVVRTGGSGRLTIAAN